MKTINEYVFDKTISSIDEYLLSKNKRNADISIDPTVVFTRLCKKQSNFNENIKNVIDYFEKILENSEMKEHASVILELIEKAIDDGYQMNYDSNLHGFYMYSNGNKESYWMHPKTIRVGIHETWIIVDFLKFDYTTEHTTLYVIEMSQETCEAYIYETDDVGVMVKKIQDNFIGWEIDYSSSVKYDIEKLKSTTKKRLGL